MTNAILSGEGAASSSPGPSSACSPGSVRCSGALVQACSAEGSFVTVALCASGACVDSTSACPDAVPCTVGEDCTAPVACDVGSTDSNGTRRGGLCIPTPLGTAAACEAPTIDSNDTAEGGTCVNAAVTTGSGAKCTEGFFDTNGNAPGGTCSPIHASCTHIKNAFPGALDGVYSVDFDGPGSGSLASDVYCIMDLKPWDPNLREPLWGAWTVAAIYGTTGRPSGWTGNAYPRPGASHYGSVDVVGADLNAIRNGATNGIRNYSIAAANLFAAGAHETLWYVGGSTRDYVSVALPSACNFFDGATYCEENKFKDLVVNRSPKADSGSPPAPTTFAGAQACTTAHHASPWADDPNDEFGIHLLQGTETDPAGHCLSGSTDLGHEGKGRIFATNQRSNGSFWTTGVASHWNAMGVRGSDVAQPGILLVHGERRSSPPPSYRTTRPAHPT